MYRKLDLTSPNPPGGPRSPGRWWQPAALRTASPGGSTAKRTSSAWSTQGQPNGQGSPDVNHGHLNVVLIRDQRLSQFSIPQMHYYFLCHTRAQGGSLTRSSFSKLKILQSLLPVHVPAFTGMYGDQAGAAHGPRSGALRHCLPRRTYLPRGPDRALDGPKLPLISLSLSQFLRVELPPGERNFFRREPGWRTGRWFLLGHTPLVQRVEQLSFYLLLLACKRVTDTSTINLKTSLTDLAYSPLFGPFVTYMI